MYIPLRPLLDDVPEDEYGGVAPGRVLPISEQWHPFTDGGVNQHSAAGSRGFRCMVALRCHPPVAPVEKSAGLGQCDVHSCRANVRKTRSCA